jgi:predicted permease
MAPPDSSGHRGIRPGIRRLFRLELHRGPRRQGDLDEEIQFHLQSRADQLVGAGYSWDDAWAEAIRRFSGPDRTLIQARDSLHRTASVQERHMSIRDGVNNVWYAVRVATRMLIRKPAFAAIVITTLALGIGATTAMFAVVDAILLRPLSFGHPDELVSITHNARAMGTDHIGASAATHFTYSRYARSLSGVAAYEADAVNVADPRGGEPERLSSATITASLIPLLQVTPLLGRPFTAAEDAPHGPAAVIISEGLWRTRFGADPHILGRTLEVNGVSREIVGVMPERFRFPAADTKLWLPLALDPADSYPGSFNYSGIGRLRPGVSLASAERDLTAALQHMVDVAPNAAPGIPTQMLLDQTKLASVVTPLKDEIVGSVAGTLWVVAATAGLVLLVACANVANLVLVRADGRQRELAVRTALGAGRMRALAPFFAELAVLGAIAGAVGLAVAAVGIHVLVRMGPSELPRLAEVRVDGAVVAFTLVTAALVALACGAIPALRLRSEALALALRDGGSRGGTEGRVRQRARGALVAAQIALALVILAASGLLLRSFRQLYDVRPGWNAEHVATFWLSLPTARYSGDSAVVRFYARLTAAVADLPAVRAVGISSRLPLETHGVNTSPIWVEDDPTAERQLPPLQLIATTDGGYFGAMGIPLIAGRTFHPIDGEQRADEAIVNRATATYFWHDSTGRGALGKRFRAIPNGKWFTVVGVVESVRDTSLQTRPAPSVYFPQAPMSDPSLTEVATTMGLVVRTSGDPSAVIKPVEQIVASLDPTLPVFDVKPMRDVVRASMARLSFTMLILGVAAAITLLLGAIGLYGVIAYVVAMRTRELGVRIALGASPGAVARMVARQGLTLAAAGIAGGLVLFALVARFIRALLFGVTPADPITLVGVAAVLVAVTALASWIPARRAAQADPMEALRSE